MSSAVIRKQRLSIVSQLAAGLPWRNDGHHAAATMDQPVQIRPPSPLACMALFRSRRSIPGTPVHHRREGGPGALEVIVANRVSKFQSPKCRVGVASPPTATRLHPAAQGQPVAHGRHPGFASPMPRSHSEGVPPSRRRRPRGQASITATVAVAAGTIGAGPSLVAPLQGAGHSKFDQTQGAPLRGDPGLRCVTPSA